jgi:hypothetical protein
MKEKDGGRDRRTELEERGSVLLQNRWDRNGGIRTALLCWGDSAKRVVSDVCWMKSFN